MVCVRLVTRAALLASVTLLCGQAVAGQKIAQNLLAAGFLFVDEEQNRKVKSVTDSGYDALT